MVGLSRRLQGNRKGGRDQKNAQYEIFQCLAEKFENAWRVFDFLLVGTIDSLSGGY